MPEIYTLSEASELTGIPRKTLGNAAGAGRLTTLTVPRGAGAVYMVEYGELLAYAARYQPQDDTRYTRPWTEADIQALIELAPTCTNVQLAKYLGRSEYAVSRKIERVKSATGGIAKRSAGRPRYTPFSIGKTAILIAKTCPTCGNLRDAKYFRKYHGKHRVDCRLCDKVKSAEREARRPKRVHNGAGKHRSAKQATTVATATRRSQEYTDRELAVVLDANKSSLQVALELGRTFYGIQGKRYQLGFIPKPPESLPDTHWVIHFPNALKALQEHFRQLGMAVPESEWDWNDDAA